MKRKVRKLKEPKIRKKKKLLPPHPHPLPQASKGGKSPPWERLFGQFYLKAKMGVILKRK